MIEVSIIVPTFNSEKYVLNLCKSIKEQTFKNYEVIIIDNNSSDKTLLKLKKISQSDKRFTYYKISNEGSIAKSRNYGIKKSIGRYIAFHDSDDFWFKNKLEVKQLIIYPKFEKNIFFLKLDKKYNKEKIEYGKIFDISNDKSRAIFFTNNNTLPSRLVTALSGKSKNQKIPFECSMGVVHENTAKKRFSWSLVSSKYKTFIHINFNTILNPQKKFSICFKIYNSENLNILKKDIFFSGKENIKDPLVYELRNIFPNYIKFLKNDYGYISIFSHNTSARMFTSLQSIRKGTTLEHAF